MNEEAGESKNGYGETEQAKDGNKWRNGFGNDRENGQRSGDGQINGAKMLQIKSNA